MKAKILAGVALVVVLILILGGLYYFFYLRNSTSAILDKDQYLLVSTDASPFFPAATINLSTGAASPVASVYAQGIDSIIDVSGEASSTTKYYILSTSDLATSNLFKRDTTNAQSPLYQLTFSPTFKYDLSYDASSQSAAYMSVTATDTTSHVMYYSPATKKEVDLGVGSNPTLLQGGFFVVFTQGNKLVSENVINQKTYPLLNVASSSVYAVDPQSLVVALFNPVVNAIQYYSIGTSVSANYLRTIKLNTLPFELTYANKKLYMFSHLPLSARAPQSIRLQEVGSSLKPIIIPNVHYVNTSLAVPNYSFLIKYE
jgi:hypothetical protein